MTYYDHSSTPVEFIKIDEDYTYTFDNGHVALLKHGYTTSLGNAKAWIAAANEIEELRTRADHLEHMVERAFLLAETYGAQGDDVYAEDIRNALKDRS